MKREPYTKIYTGPDAFTEVTHRLQKLLEKGHYAWIEQLYGTDETTQYGQHHFHLLGWKILWIKHNTLLRHMEEHEPLDTFGL